MKGSRKSFITLIGVILCGFFLFLTNVNALEIVLEPDNAQREIGGKVRVHVYANGASDLISMGITVSFDASVLQVVSASKYEDVDYGWLLDADGDPATTDDQYNDPPVEVDNTSGTVTMIGGHMAGPSTGGLTGKVLLGWIVFDAVGNDNSNLTVDLANPAPFDNFVALGGMVDEPTNVPSALGIICVKAGAHPGDINGNGWVEPGDYAVLRSHMMTGFPDPNYNVLADLNGNGWVEPGDYAILRSHMMSACLPCP